MELAARGVTFPHLLRVRADRFIIFNCFLGSAVSFLVLSADLFRISNSFFRDYGFKSCLKLLDTEMMKGDFNVLFVEPRSCFPYQIFYTVLQTSRKVRAPNLA